MTDTTQTVTERSQWARKAFEYSEVAASIVGDEPAQKAERKAWNRVAQVYFDRDYAEREFQKAYETIGVRGFGWDNGTSLLKAQATQVVTANQISLIEHQVGKGVEVGVIIADLVEQAEDRVLTAVAGGMGQSTNPLSNEIDRLVLAQWGQAVRNLKGGRY